MQWARQTDQARKVHNIIDENMELKSRLRKAVLQATGNRELADRLWSIMAAKETEATIMNE